MPRVKYELMEQGAEMEGEDSARVMDVKPCELRARRMQTRSSDNETKVVERKDEGKDKGSDVVEIGNLREEQRTDGELKKIIQ